jgi:L-amino acid N-acyltransferase YncA
MTAVVANTTKLGGHRPPLQEATIRDAVEADLSAIVEIYNAAILTRISTAQLETVSVDERLPWFREHSTESYPLWVAEIDGRVAGWLSFHPFLKRGAYRATAEISIYVSEKFRRTGVGSALLEKAIAHSPSLKITALVGCVFAHNEPSLRLFERFGFGRWGFLPRIARVEEIERDLVIVGRRISAQA